jgi:hypothetical protein
VSHSKLCASACVADECCTFGNPAFSLWLLCAGYSGVDVAQYLSAVRGALNHPNLATDLHLPGAQKYRAALAKAAQAAAAVHSLAAPALDSIMMHLALALRSAYSSGSLAPLRCLYNTFIGYSIVAGGDQCEEDDLRAPPPPLPRPPLPVITTSTPKQGLSSAAVGAIVGSTAFLGILGLGLLIYCGSRPRWHEAEAVRPLEQGRGGLAAGMRGPNAWAAQLQSCMGGVAHVCQRYAHTVHPKLNEAWQQARSSGVGVSWLEKGRYVPSLLSLVVTDIGEQGQDTGCLSSCTALSCGQLSSGRCCAYL